MIALLISAAGVLAIVALALGGYIGVQEVRHIRKMSTLRSSAREQLRTESLGRTDAETLATKRGKELEETRRIVRVLEASNIELANVIGSKDKEIVEQSARLSALTDELSQSQRACHAATTSNGLMSRRLSTIHRESAPGQRGG